ncbi:uncharacterized protein LOC123943693 [Meles meles]|uniref:uncharacterized protein LOC123943693 n=1 Tax=Meles meles TaxID=9662 RepID=UPI001E699E1D|nr:uncharacterized protein LOC123943693 [Meles meles]
MGVARDQACRLDAGPCTALGCGSEVDEALPSAPPSGTKSAPAPTAASAVPARGRSEGTPGAAGGSSWVTPGGRTQEGRTEAQAATCDLWRSLVVCPGWIASVEGRGLKRAWQPVFQKRARQHPSGAPDSIRACPRGQPAARRGLGGLSATVSFLLGSGERTCSLWQLDDPKGTCPPRSLAKKSSSASVGNMTFLPRGHSVLSRWRCLPRCPALPPPRPPVCTYLFPGL